MKRQIFSLFLLLLTLVACGDKPLDPNKPVYVKIKTTMGDVTVLLYDDTPLHRDNFIKLCQSNEYEGMLFHRVIKEFVVQGGDPESKAHEPGALYGDGDGGYTVPAEILPNHFNKKGALIDAKEIDAVAYTAGPGLVGALLVGATVGRSLAFAWNVPAVPVHHMEGHLLAPMLEDNPPQYP